MEAGESGHSKRSDATQVVLVTEVVELDTVQVPDYTLKPEFWTVILLESAVLVSPESELIESVTKVVTL